MVSFIILLNSFWKRLTEILIRLSRIMQILWFEWETMGSGVNQWTPAVWTVCFSMDSDKRTSTSLDFDEFCCRSKFNGTDIMDNRVTHLLQDCFMEAISTVTFKLKATIDLNLTTVTFQLLFGIVWSNCRNGRNLFDDACINRYYISYNTM